MSPREQLKAATLAVHDSLDSMFSRFDLADPGDYRRFLEAHARCCLDAKQHSLPRVRTRSCLIGRTASVLPRSQTIS